VICVLTDGSCNYEKRLTRLFLLVSLNVFVPGLCMVYALPDAFDVDGLGGRPFNTYAEGGGRSIKSVCMRMGGGSTQMYVRT
jgi:hypothetical protein